MATESLKLTRREFLIGTAVAGVGPARVVVLDAADPDAGPSQRLSDGRTAARVRVPALGVAPFDPQPVADRVVLSDTSMTNGRLAIRWDTFGSITSIIDLARARELVPTGEFAAVLELAVDQPVPIVVHPVLTASARAGRVLLLVKRRRATVSG